MKKKNKKAEEDYQDLLKETIKNKYPLVIVGLVILFLFGSLISSYVNQKLINNKKQTDSNKTIQIEEKSSTKNQEKIIIVIKGQSLWDIAEDNYGSGYNWVDIAKANKITNPDLIFKGMRLKIPTIKHKKLTKGEVIKIKTSKIKEKITRYKVNKGDSLSKIALKAYGDVFAWQKIAKVNHIKNPSLIYPNQILQIP